MRRIIRALACLSALALPVSSAAQPAFVYSTYLGGAGEDLGLAIAADAAGNTYVTGYTDGGFGFDSFPVTHSLQTELGTRDVFVTKLDAAGRLVYSTLLGGGGDDYPRDIAVDAAGHVYVTGETNSPDFPTVRPASHPAGELVNDVFNVFVAKLSPDGAALVWSTTLGGPGWDAGAAVAVDADGYAYVTGATDSPGFPTTAAALQPSYRGGFDAFVTKLSPEGALVWSTFLGGTEVDAGSGIGVDRAGFVHVGGTTSSDDFPTARAHQGSRAGNSDAFVARIDPAGSVLAGSTYLGGSEYDLAHDLAVDPAGNAYLAGITLSPDFPLRNALQSTLRHYDGFTSKLSATGTLVWSTFLGSSHADTARSIAVDAAGSVYVAGSAGAADFPVHNALRPMCEPGPFACQDAFALKLNPQGNALVWSTFLGGTDSSNIHPFFNNDYAYGVAADRQGNAYVTGVTPAEDFLTVNAFDPFYSGGIGDAFVVKIGTANRPPGCAAAVVSPDQVGPPNGKLRAVSIRAGDPDGDPVTVTVTSIHQDEPLSRRGVADASGVGTARPQVRADRQGGGDGRVYHLVFTAADGHGGACAGKATVCVPHDQRPGATCGDGGALFASTPR